MRNFTLMGQGLNMVPLMIEIGRQPDLWKADTYLRDYPQGPFQDVDTIFLRFPPASVTELERASKDQHECEWMAGAIALPAARPLIYALMGQVSAERLGRVMINRIRPGGRIYPHPDTKAHAEYYERFHYVVHADPGVIFRCGDEEISPRTGELWWFRHGLEHEVNNHSESDRIHLIIDLRLGDFTRANQTPTKPAPVCLEPPIELLPDEPIPPLLDPEKQSEEPPP